MLKPIVRLSISKARANLTRLERFLPDRGVLEVVKRNKPYAVIHLAHGEDPYERILQLIAGLPEPRMKSRKAVAERYKSLLFRRSIR